MHPPLADVLIEFGADVHATDHGGDNLLHLAATRGNPPMVRWALHRGVDMRATNAAGHTPLQAVQCEIQALYGSLGALRKAVLTPDHQPKNPTLTPPEAAAEWAQILSLLGDPRFSDFAEA